MAAEEVLLSALEELLGEVTSAEDSRHGHLQLKRLMDRVAQGLASWNLPQFHEDFDTFTLELERHWQHELDVLLPDFLLLLNDRPALERVQERLARV